jgi:hypothetical protein
LPKDRFRRTTSWLRHRPRDQTPEVPPPVTSKPSRRRATYILIGIVLGALALVAVLVIVPILTNAGHPMTAAITLPPYSKCASRRYTPGRIDLSSLASDSLIVADANTGATLAVSEAVQPVGACQLNVSFNVPYSARFVEISDTSKSQVRWGPLDMRQIAAHGWTVYLTADGILT